MPKSYGQFIAGRWSPSSNKATIESRSPATRKLLATFAQGSRADVADAVGAAESARGAWKRMPAPRRGELLLRAAQIFRERKDRLGNLVAEEMGKIVSEGRGDVQEAIDFFEYVAGEGRRMFGITTPSELPNKLLMTRREPFGVVGLITPWNFPIAIPAWKAGAALVCGNTFVLKPAEQTSLCAAAFIDVLVEAGFPKGVVNMVTGMGEVAGDALVGDERVRAISFTGGVETGKIVAQKAAGRLAACGLELGGKNPMIVMDDANQDLALEGLMFGAFGTAGQRCTATSRLILHEGIFEEFLAKLASSVKALRIGDPTKADTQIGPVNSEEQLKKILGYIDIGKKEAELVTGGKRVEKGWMAKGFFVEPTVFVAKHGARISKEEIFGPVLTVIKFRDLDEAVRIANDVQYGLSSAIYTENVNHAFKTVDRLEAGLCYINAPTIGAEVQVPFGGVKATGNGTREAGPTAIEEFSELKTVIVEYSGRLQKAQIDTQTLNAPT
jgi:alpha-ketoglutaric semialdehyde dehydrogenase